VFENFDISKIKFLASSCGCFAAVPLACGLDPYEWCKKDWGKCMDHFESRSLGCLFDSKEFYIQLWDEFLPENAHELCSGRLFISVTLYPSMTNNVLSDFRTRQDLIQAIVASTCLPYLFMRDYPVDCGAAQGGMAIDGGFSNDSPCLDSYTITVSALMDEADIVPNMEATSGGHRNDRNANTDTSPSINTNTTCSSRGGSGEDDVITEDGTDDEDISKISFLDIVRTPLYSRVWEIAQLGERSASQCRDLAERHEWQAVHKSAVETPPSPSRPAFHKPSDPLYIPMFSTPLHATHHHHYYNHNQSDSKKETLDKNRRRLHSM
jgi:hypothetical protein